MTAKRCEEMLETGENRVKVKQAMSYHGRNRRTSSWTTGTLLGVEWTQGRHSAGYARIVLDGTTEAIGIHPSLVQPA